MRITESFKRELEKVPPEAARQIRLRMREFERVRNSPSDRWFSELCFCILTANSKAETAISIQNSLGTRGFTDSAQEEIARAIKSHKHRFHNVKAGYIIEARKHRDIKSRIMQIIASERDEMEGAKKARDWLVENVKGLGMKEASHFLRNVGFPYLAVLDRHILRFIKQQGMVKEVPKTISRKEYLKLESILESACNQTGMNQGELDFYMWFLMTGRVLK
ncbi:N-glycosylase/DNA lyase [Candidatus Woesearchaeota archaeon]|nr:MAG: N-glycosylase/DNA lyase [Candidatus Woesearchaeota archaeon]